MAKLNFFADISLHGIVPETFAIDNKITDIMENSLNIGNLESPLTDSIRDISEQARALQANKSQFKIIDNFQILSLANNHILDFGEKGIEDTIQILKSQQIAYFGIGKTQKEALTPYITSFADVNFAFIGATRYANAKKSWGTSPENLSQLKRTIQLLKKEGFFVILYFHWSYEYIRIPPPRDRKIAHKCIDYGADLIIGAHPHVFQGMEIYKGKHIFYSLGNYIFNSKVFENLSYIPNDPRLQNSFFVSVDINKDHSYSTEIFPYHTDDQGVCLLEDEDKKLLEKELRHVSDIFQKSYYVYWKAYYRQTPYIIRQNSKVRNKFLKVHRRKWLRKYNDFLNANWQDILNNLAARVSWIFRK